MGLEQHCVKVWACLCVLSCVCCWFFFPEIAASFAKAVHFNTFGGNPVACAIALSVLDVRVHPLCMILQLTASTASKIMKEIKKEAPLLMVSD